MNCWSTTVCMLGDFFHIPGSRVLHVVMLYQSRLIKLVSVNHFYFWDNSVVHITKIFAY